MHGSGATHLLVFFVLPIVYPLRRAFRPTAQLYPQPARFLPFRTYAPTLFLSPRLVDLLIMV